MTNLEEMVAELKSQLAAAKNGEQQLVVFALNTATTTFAIFDELVTIRKLLEKQITKSAKGRMENDVTN